MNIDICKEWICALFENPETTIAWMLVAAVIGFAIASVQNYSLPRTARKMLNSIERTAWDNRWLQRLVVKASADHAGWLHVTLYVRAKPPESEPVNAPASVFLAQAAKRLARAGLCVETTHDGLTAIPQGPRTLRLLPKNQRHVVQQAA